MAKSSFISNWIKRIKAYDRIVHISEIARRYFVINTFDGVMTMLGILLGSFFTGIDSARVIIIACLGAAIAITVSGVWGAYFAERAERLRALRELEQAMLTKLASTEIGKASKAAILIIALVDGLSPFVAALVLISPFFFVDAHNIKVIYLISISIAFIMLFLLGLFLGRISKESVLGSGLKMVLAGIVCALLGLLIKGFV